VTRSWVSRAFVGAVTLVAAGCGSSYERRVELFQGAVSARGVAVAFWRHDQRVDDCGPGCEQVGYEDWSMEAGLLDAGTPQEIALGVLSAAADDDAEMTGFEVRLHDLERWVLWTYRSPADAEGGRSHAPRVWRDGAGAPAAPVTLERRACAATLTLRADGAGLLAMRTDEGQLRLLRLRGDLSVARDTELRPFRLQEGDPCDRVRDGLALASADAADGPMVAVAATPDPPAPEDGQPAAPRQVAVYVGADNGDGEVGEGFGPGDAQAVWVGADGSVAVVVRGEPVAGDADPGLLTLVRRDGGDLVEGSAQVSTPLPPHGRGCDAFAFDPAGRLLALHTSREGVFADVELPGGGFTEVELPAGSGPVGCAVGHDGVRPHFLWTEPERATGEVRTVLRHFTLEGTRPAELAEPVVLTPDRLDERP